jgi:hypothetical protein
MTIDQVIPSAFQAVAASGDSQDRKATKRKPCAMACFTACTA